MANQPNPAPGGAGNPAPAANPPVQNQPVTAVQQPAAQQSRRARGARTSPPAARLAYTRHATAGNSDDRINSQALVTFWKVMTVLGGVAILWILVSTSHCVGRQGGVMSPTSVTPPSSASVYSSLPPAPVPVAIPSIVFPPARVEITNKIEVMPEQNIPAPPTAPKSCDQYSGARRLSCERWAKIK